MAVHLIVGLREICIVTLFLPLGGLFVCFVTGYIFQAEEIHETHCRVNVIDNFTLGIVQKFRNVFFSSKFMEIWQDLKNLKHYRIYGRSLAFFQFPNFCFPFFFYFLWFECKILINLVDNFFQFGDFAFYYFSFVGFVRKLWRFFNLNFRGILGVFPSYLIYLII